MPFQMQSYQEACLKQKHRAAGVGAIPTLPALSSRGLARGPVAPKNNLTTLTQEATTITYQMLPHNWAYS